MFVTFDMAFDNDDLTNIAFQSLMIKAAWPCQGAVEEDWNIQSHRIERPWRSGPKYLDLRTILLDLENAFC
jgi:hypothetical protein